MGRNTTSVSMLLGKEIMDFMYLTKSSTVIKNYNMNQKFADINPEQDFNCWKILIGEK